MKSTHDILYEFSQQTKKIMGSKLKKLFYMVPMLVEITMKIQILML